MRCFDPIVLFLLLVYDWNEQLLLLDGSILSENDPPGYKPVGNPNVPLEEDCALRAFMIEMAEFIAPEDSKKNWTELSRSALQMDECKATKLFSGKAQQSIRYSKPARVSPNDPLCDRRIFVHDSIGDDQWDGSLNRPLKTIQKAVSYTRALRAHDRLQSKLCITIRGGTYYLGANATATSSQTGAIGLTTEDSNLLIENYEDERVVLSGGVLLELQWSMHRTTAAGETIMKAEVPSSVNLDQFNELYIDERRGILAKYPNGDPATQGLYAKNPGFSYDAKKWWPPIYRRGIDIHVDQPYRNGTVFSNYQLGLGGDASVFHPPRSFWTISSPHSGRRYGVPRGLTVNPGALPHMDRWSKPTTGFVHAFHGNYWGSWVFDIASVNHSENTIMFGRGGFQEARGAEIGGAYYVSNIFEELDSPNEWFLDGDTRTLYFMPNGTMPKVFVASQIPCILSIRGNGIDDRVENISIHGLTWTQTSHTYMGGYMVPSGGDWSVHRGGTIYLSNTKKITIERNSFTQLGSNGIAIIDHNEDHRILLNEFVWLADSGIVLVGTTNGIDGFSVASQPANVEIRSNLIHETGIYIKQSSPIFISVCRSIAVIGNLMFNMPRAAININDGFYGNHTISRNVIFNTVRETTDHGLINTWDRQPFLTDGRNRGVPSLDQHMSYIHHNALLNNYHSIWPLDHDDGSCFYEDSYNFQIYGGKKNFLGHSKIDHHELYVYSDVAATNFPTNVCLYDHSPMPETSGWNETWIQNICALYRNPIPYDLVNCDVNHPHLPYLANNQIYIPAEEDALFPCQVNGRLVQLNLTQWQSYGFDIGTMVRTTPDIQTIIQWGREMLQQTV